MDFNETPPAIAVREFLAIVLAGFGDKLRPLTSDYGDEPCPKALLPIGNKPMLDYPLTWLEQSGIRDVLLICPLVHRSAISHYIHSESSSSSISSLRIDLQTLDESQESGIGTCTVLRHFANRIQGDFILLPCDFVPSPSFSLVTILNRFRADVISDGAIATACWIPSSRPEKGAIPDEWGDMGKPHSVVWNEATGTLLHIDSPDDIDRNGDELEIRMSLLSRYPRSKLSSNLQDTHVYICRRSVLDAVMEKSYFDSFQEEFMPWLCKVQYQRTKREKYGHVLNPITNSPSQATIYEHSTFRSSHRNAYLSIESTPNTPRMSERTLSMPSSPSPSDRSPAALPSLRVALVVHRPESGHMGRANSLYSYLELNRHTLASASYSLPTDPENRALIDQKAHISQDSIVGASTKIGERTSVKRSVIGKHCQIGKAVKIAGCIILDHCVILDGAKLEGCILGKNTKVGAKADLVKTVTQAGMELEEGENYKNEKLEVSDWTAGPIDTDEGDTDES